MKTSTYIKITIAGIILTLGAFIGINVYVDPLFHYHAPTEGLEYPLYDERYMNYGIAKHFTYDSIITGTSMTQNFKTSLWDNYFGTTSIKTPFAGATYKEVNDLLKCAFDHNDSIAVVMRSLDPTVLIVEKDEMDYEDYPDYLYDNNLLNDVNYVLNKEIFFSFTEYVRTFMKLGGSSTDFDTYKNWSGMYQYDENLMRESFVRREKQEEIQVLSEDDVRKIKENLEANVISLVREHPETDFYLFFPPYSIYFWDDLSQDGQMLRTLEAHRKAIEMLLEYENIKLYSFFDNTDIICNLNYYKDSLHYNQEISDLIMDSMALGEGRLTKENYKEYMEFLHEFYVNYDYEALFYQPEEIETEEM
ncbi:MAG: hypothetical protein IKW30_10370 [Lachnospiraceae bacterium]|nr:hypothetical protein [Lachnospiraceae bacterium]